MNIGKAHLENRNSGKASETFEAAVRLRPNSAPAKRNLARSQYLALNFDAALETLAQARALEPDSTATSYLTGLAHSRASRFEQALPHLERAVRLDPHTATLRYQLSTVLHTLGRHEQAVEQLRETVRLDPLHASAHYRLGSHARKAGDKDEFLRQHREFLRLRKLLGEAARNPKTLEQCVYAQPEPPRLPGRPGQAERDREPIKVQFADTTPAVFGKEADRAATAAAVIDVEPDGRCTLLVVAPEGTLALLGMSPEGRFVRQTVAPDLPQVGGVRRCLVGDFHDDVPEGVRYDPRKHIHNDVLLLSDRGVRLLKRIAAAKFDDVTKRAGLLNLEASAAAWLDYEHDGDLDLLLAIDGGLQLWQNNGDGSFANVTATSAITDAGAVVAVAAADLNSDLAVDFLALRGKEPTIVFENQRVGQFARQLEPPGPWPPAGQVLVNDLNNDGQVDAALFSDREGVVLFGRSSRRQRLALEGIQVAAAVLIDFDNDGWLDILVAGSSAGETERGAVRLWRNVGGNAWVDATSASGLTALESPPIVDVVAGDFEGDGDSDLLLVEAGGRLRFLRNDGGDKNGQLKIRLIPTKTNPSGYGTHLEVRAGSFWVTRSASAVPVEIGLGGRTQLDSVQTIWTNGVIDNQIGIASGRTPLEIVESNVAVGSCPLLYAWDGERFRFITDIVGNSPVGMPLTRDMLMPADPDEIVAIGRAETFLPRDGDFTIEITSEFREAVYLDHVQLLAVDHPSNVEVHPTDKLVGPPFPDSLIRALGAEKRLVAAVSDDGIDFAEALRTIDGIYVLPGVPLPAPYRGMCHPASLTLDFGAIDATQPLVLALTGWLQYGDASTNIALSQNPALTVIPPMLEAEIGPDVWTPVDVRVGMPAGKTKTILCDLAGRLPEGVRRLRLTGTFEIHWDRIALFEGRPIPGGQPLEVLPRAARLYQRGFSEIKSRAPGHPTTPDYDAVRDHPPWRTTLQGWCTRYGDVLDLLTRRDNSLVILNGGDAVTVEFAATELPPPADGLERSFFLYSVGWDKDADHNVLTGQTIEPIPFDESARGGETDEVDSDWRLRYNTRWVRRDHFARKR